MDKLCFVWYNTPEAYERGDMKDAAIYEILLYSTDTRLVSGLTEDDSDRYLFRVVDTTRQMETAIENFALDLFLIHAQEEEELTEVLSNITAENLPPVILLASPWVIQKKDMARRLVELGMTRFIPWPLEMNDLLERLHNHFARNPKPARSLKYKRLYRKGEPIFLENEVGDECYVIVSGRVRICRVIDSRTLKEVGQLGPGEVFGETALLRSCRRTGTALAVDDVIVTVSTRETFDRVVETDRNFTTNMVTQLKNRVLDLEQKIPSLAIEGAENDKPGRRGKKSGSHARVFQPGELIFKSDELAKWFYYIESGSVELTPTGTNGDSEPITLSEYELLGDVAFQLNRPYGQEARAITETSCLALSDQNLEYGLEAHPTIHLRMAQGLAGRLSVLLEMLSARQMHEVF